MDKPLTVYTKIEAEDVPRVFEQFMEVYEAFRKANGLGKVDKSAFELCTAMTDKLGRICRHAKHAERNDPKSDFPDGMTREMMGILAYMIMLIDHFGVDIRKGFVDELESTTKQYASRSKK